MKELNKEQWETRLLEIDKIAKENYLKTRSEKCYCFLDFDGVINIWNRQNVDKSIKEEEFQMLDIDCVRRLSDFCLSSNVQLVISSSWRLKGLEYCRNFLVKGGLHRNVPVVGTTALDLDADREVHITDFLLEHPDFTNFIIIDDIRFHHLASKVIKCDAKIGYDEKKKQESYALLEKLMRQNEALLYEQSELVPIEAV